MAQDFTLAFEQGEPIKTITTVGSANFVLVTVPESTKRISIGCELTNLYVSFSYIDNAPANTANSCFVVAGNLLTTTIPNGLDSFSVIAKTGSASNVVVIMEELL